MKFPFLSKTTEIKTTATSATSPWLWPSCATSPRTQSFRTTTDNGGNIYKTMHSAYNLDDKNNKEFLGPFGNHHREISNPAKPENIIESAVIRGLLSERLFFEPGETSSVLEIAKTGEGRDLCKERVAIMEVESRDPLVDFRASMEEMVEARLNGIEDWEFLEELLACFLRVNDKSSHGYILGACVDLLIRHLANSEASKDLLTLPLMKTCSFTSPMSSSSSSSTYSSIAACLPSHGNEDEITIQKHKDSSSL
ncbi:hypothetical protein MIMGU_mgv1a020229mg [Erythranthe guttata]|uniref:Transcription repressor n=1 Tax=Erythranthe guttata TaxID=4155 RepID=A0A022RF78_ERYGU|nr:hypothetical protein MIMGU_mgv1a020229mg [Erythranthe guttata]